MKVRLQTSRGDIVVALHTEQAPKTVANFLEYVNSDFYNGTIFHRVIDGFMIQGGGFEPGMNQKSTRNTIENEADNGLSNLTGTVAMARTPNPHSASAQFFINVGDNTFLDFKARTEAGWGYCVFGEVVDGTATVDAIKASATGTRSGHQDVPEQDVVIERAEVMTD